MHYNDAATRSASSTHTYIRVSCTVNFRIKVYFVYRFTMYIQTSREAAKSIRFRSRRVSFYLFVGISFSRSLCLSLFLYFVLATNEIIIATGQRLLPRRTGSLTDD